MTGMPSATYSSSFTGSMKRVNGVVEDRHDPDVRGREDREELFDREQPLSNRTTS